MSSGSFLGGVFGENATKIHQQFRSGAVELFAPDHVFNELASAITFASRGRSARLTAQDARLILAQAIELGIRTVQTTELLLAAFDLVHRHGTSIYDPMYLALSDALPASLITADERFYNAVNAQRDVLWLGDLPAE